MKTPMLPCPERKTEREIESRRTPRRGSLLESTRSLLREKGTKVKGNHVMVRQPDSGDKKMPLDSVP